MNELMRRLHYALKRNEEIEERLGLIPARGSVYPVSEPMQIQPVQREQLPVEAPIPPTEPIDDETSLKVLFAAAAWFRDQTGYSVSLKIDGEQLPTFESGHENLVPRKIERQEKQVFSLPYKMKGGEAVHCTASIKDLIRNWNAPLPEYVLFRVQTVFYHHLYMVNAKPAIPLRVLHQQLIQWNDLDHVFDDQFAPALVQTYLPSKHSDGNMYPVLPIEIAVKYLEKATLRKDIGLRN